MTTSSKQSEYLTSAPFGAPFFTQISDVDFLPLLAESLAEDRNQLKAIEGSTEEPTFENTILALETLNERSSQVSKLFFNLLGTNSSPARQELAQKISPQLAEFASDVSLNESVFKRVKSVFDSRETLEGESLRLTEHTMRSFVRNGALLNDEGKTRIRQIDQRLSQLGLSFSDNVLQDTNQFFLELVTADDFDGLPDSVREMYKELGKKRGQPEGTGAVGLQAPQYLPFMTYSKRRGLREKLWRAYNSRGHKKNGPLMTEILQLRQERAHLLGYKNHAEFVLEERMAKRPETVTAFINKMAEKALPAAKRDLAELTAHAASVDKSAQSEATIENRELKPWDYLFQSESLKRKLHAIDSEALRPYFECSRVLNGVFEHASKLFGLQFRHLPDQPVPDPTATAYEVSAESGHIGLLYVDLFARDSKRSGAWMTAFREQGYSRLSRAVERPLISIVCNFTPATATTPSLLTLDEVKTLFHEFGHALHGLLSQCRYVSLGGTNVKWDFVELPSQLFENWVGEKESLHIFARHYQTGELLPSDVIDRLKKASQFQAGYMTVRQLQFADLDMKFHSVPASEISDPFEFELNVLKPLAVFQPEPGAQFGPAFTHIFSGGYSAGYYSYKWAEVLDADAFELFLEKGLFDKDSAKSLKENILSRGDAEEPEVLYRLFRGRDPDPDAALRRDGLIS